MVNESNKKRSISIPNLIGAMIFLALGVWLFIFGISYSSQFGPPSDTCKNLSAGGYFETHYEYTGHDSCIDGEYEWKEDCKMILPWWIEPTRCMYDYDHDNFNDTCNQARADKSLKIYKEYQSFGINCITHPINKLFWFWPLFLSIMIIGISITLIYSSIKQNKNES